LIGIFWILSGGQFVLEDFIARVMRNPLSYGLAFGAAVTSAAYCSMTRAWSNGENCSTVIFLLDLILFAGMWSVGVGGDPVITTKGVLSVIFGGAAMGLAYAALLHIIVHSLLKVALFMTADNIQLAYNTQKISSVSGLLGNSRKNGLVYLIATLALCGMPPSPLFVTEIMLVAGAGPWLGGFVLLLLFVVFGGMTYHAMRMTMGGKVALAVDESEIRQLEKLSFIPRTVLILAVLAGVVILTIWLVGSFQTAVN
jgi:hypothetical protein